MIPDTSVTGLPATAHRWFPDSVPTGTLTGRVVSDRLTISGNGILEQHPQ